MKIDLFCNDCKASFTITPQQCGEYTIEHCPSCGSTFIEVEEHEEVCED